MSRQFLAIALLAATLTPAIAWAGPRSSGAAQTAVPDSKKSKNISWIVNINAQSPSNGTSGPCTGGTGLADFCPVGPCDCFTSTGTASGTVGHGTVTVYETIDSGQIGVGDGDCTTAYFDIEISGSKDTESIGGYGGDCVNPDITPTEYVAGGCELGAASTLYSDAEGHCSGSYGAAEKNGNFPLKISIKGNAIK